MGVEFDRISDDQCRWLERPFSLEEVKSAMNSMEDDKALGPDGFLIKFLKVCWEVVGDDVMEVLSDFHSKGQWCKILSTTFITLIPKKKGVVELKGFRSISLVGCIYKLLAKILAIRLKMVLGDVITKSQHAFVPIRQMIDCSLMANEIIDAMKRVGWEGVICKVDMENAYDHVNWAYVDWVLDQMGFSVKYEGKDKR